MSANPELRDTKFVEVEVLPITGLKEKPTRNKYVVGDGEDVHHITEEATEDAAATSPGGIPKRSKTERLKNKYNQLSQQFYDWRLRHSLIQWRLTLVAGVVLTASIFLFNLILTLSVALSRRLHDGQDIIYEGNCSKVKTINSILHLLINGTSTILLSTSNYTMQVLSAPTRPQVDMQHAKNKWLDIGVTSMRNLRRTGRANLICWCILGLSSLPLHLFYNSTIFSTISTYGFDIVAVNHDFVKPDGLDRFSSTDLDVMNQKLHYYQSENENKSQIYELHSSVSRGAAENLTNENCIRAFAQPYQTSRRAVVLVSDYNVSEVAVDDGHYCPTGYNCWPNSIVHNRLGVGIVQVGPPTIGYPDDSCWWNRLTDHNCQAGLKAVLANHSNWAPFQLKIDYCIGLPAEEKCKLQFSVPLMAIVLSMNFTKAIVLLWTVLTVKHAPLLTIGDAVASFLAVPDSTTSSQLLLCSPYTFKAFTVGSRDKLHSNTRPQRWGTVVSRKKWTVSLLICLLIGLLSAIIGVIKTGVDGSLVFNKGFGSLAFSNFIYDGDSVTQSGFKGFFVNAILANLPQLTVSTLYFVYNGLYTTMAFGVEWSSLASKQKGLRVSSIPSGSQRGTYFLSLPFRFSLPMMSLWGFLHWILSQSFYLVSVEFVNAVLSNGYASFDGASPIHDGEIGDRNNFFTCGVFPVGIMLVLILTVLIIAGVVIIGFARLPTNIPLVGNNSRLISAACHPVVWNEGDELRPIRLGLRSDPNGTGLNLSFSSQPVDYSSPSAVYDWWSLRMKARLENAGRKAEEAGNTAPR